MLCEWLSSALQVQVTGFSVLDAHAGTTGRALLALEYGVPTDMPERLFVKLPPGDQQQREFVTSSGMGRREALFYHSLASELPVRVPRCYFATSDAAGDDYIMLLENLVDSGCTFKNASKRYSPAYIRQIRPGAENTRCEHACSLYGDGATVSGADRCHSPVVAARRTDADPR